MARRLTVLIDFVHDPSIATPAAKLAAAMT